MISYLILFLISIGNPPRRKRDVISKEEQARIDQRLDELEVTNSGDSTCMPPKESKFDIK